jgi:hypothetical protein
MIDWKLLAFATFVALALIYAALAGRGLAP